MKILLDNVNTRSSSGPNGFAKKILSEFSKDHDVFTSVHEFADMKASPDVQLSFIVTQNNIAPVIQRLDGIYFNTDQDYMKMNDPILATYQDAKAVICQSRFNKNLTFKWFGEHSNCHVINNGTCMDEIEKISPIDHPKLNELDDIWCCASSWRPHKRLAENIRYFLEFSSENDCLVIAGENPDYAVSHPRVFYANHLPWPDLISLFKKSKYFIHLSWLDHCPNVVIDARAAGCQIICSSSGGTKEIAGTDAIIIEEDSWDLSPVKLYKPPAMDFSKTIKNQYDADISIARAASQYLEVFDEVLSQ